MTQSELFGREGLTSARHTEAKTSLPISRVEARFVYEGGVKGEWVDLREALSLWMTPAPGYEVNRVEFQEKERPPRK
jgi:hypothetical protein